MIRKSPFPPVISKEAHCIWSPASTLKSKDKNGKTDTTRRWGRVKKAPWPWSPLQSPLPIVSTWSLGAGWAVVPTSGFPPAGLVHQVGPSWPHTFTSSYNDGGRAWQGRHLSLKEGRTVTLPPWVDVAVLTVSLESLLWNTSFHAKADVQSGKFSKRITEKHEVFSIHASAEVSVSVSGRLAGSTGV